MIHVGMLEPALVHPREVFRPAIIKTASIVVVCHNHPSGDPQPSRQDEALTKRLWAAGAIMGIHLYYHLVIAGDNYVSMRAAGVVGPPPDSEALLRTLSRAMLVERRRRRGRKNTRASN